MYIYWILLLAVSVTCDPFLIPLKGKEGPGIYTIYNVEGGGKLYLASNDANESLNKITLVTGTVNITLDQLYDFSDTPKFITVSDKVVLSNQNLDDVTDALTGYLYITTKQQADDPNFSVAVIKTNHTIVTTNANSTVVILNTALISDSDEIDKPLKTSRVTNINQSANTEFDFHWGIPAKNWTTITKNRFFENPILAANCYNNGTCTRYKKTFNNIEPLQINQDYWYLKSSGPLTMTIENKFVRTLNYTTTAFETTGIIVNNDVFLEHTVNFILDPTRERDAGVIVSTFIESNDTLIEFRLLDENGGEIEMSFDAKGQSIHEQMDVLDPAKFLVVNSTSIHPGVFYCQYYGFQGDLLPKTTMRPTTSMTPSTVISTTVPTVSTVIPISSAPVFSTTVSVLLSTQPTTVIKTTVIPSTSASSTQTEPATVVSTTVPTVSTVTPLTPASSTVTQPTTVTTVIPSTTSKIPTTTSLTSNEFSFIPLILSILFIF